LIIAVFSFFLALLKQQQERPEKFESSFRPHYISGLSRYCLSSAKKKPKCHDYLNSISLPSFELSAM